MSGEVNRAPAERAARIAPLPTLPLFHRLEGRRAVVAGASEAALWKAELLAAAGADVLLLAGQPADALGAMPIITGPGRLRRSDRSWDPADLAGAALAVADLDEEEAAAFAAAARDRSVPVNIVDRPELCDVQFGTIVDRSPILIAISTSGGAPMLGQSIRTRIEAMLPSGLSAWASAALTWRPQVKARIAAFADRRAFWQRFTERAWRQADRRPTGLDLESLLRGADPMPIRTGKVALVGAGPGDPELLTLQAVRALQSASVILHDDLVGPDIFRLVRREARLIAVGKTGHAPSCRQESINEIMVRLAQAGETVVRLKGGDPLIFSRAAEEIQACRRAGIDVTIVPGISAAQGAAARLGIPLTERLLARRVQFVTGHGADGELPDDIDWTSLADPAATTIIYMPRRTIRDFVGRALGQGLPPSTPAVAVASATRPDQVHAAAPLAEIAAACDGLPRNVPVLIMIGEVARELLEPASVRVRQKEAA